MEEDAFGIARSAECVGGGVVGDQIDALFRRRSSSSSFIIPSEYVFEYSSTTYWPCRAKKTHDTE